MTDGVVLLHGLGRTPASLWRANYFFKGKGYKTISLSYPSRSAPVETLARNLEPKINEFAAKIDGQVHFLTHSMGGLIALSLIQQNRPKNLGKVVMMAPPLGGSEVADFIAANPALRRLFGPAIRDLTTAARRGASVDFPLGVIAGDRTVNPILSMLFLRGPNDGKVEVARTHADGMADHIVLPISHPMIPWRADALRQANAFFDHGQFQR